MYFNRFLELHILNAFTNTEDVLINIIEIFQLHSRLLQRIKYLDTKQHSHQKKHLIVHFNIFVMRHFGIFAITTFKIHIFQTGLPDRSHFGKTTKIENVKGNTIYRL